MLAPFPRVNRVHSRSAKSTKSRRLAAAARRSLRNALPRLEMLENRTLLSTYYVSNGGNDSNSGTSASSPWASIDKANSVSLHPGDKLLFEGGQTFHGELYIGGNDSGTPGDPITVSSYGSGRAELTGTTSHGVNVVDAHDVDILNLIVKGTGPGGGSNYGIKIDSNLGGDTTLSNIAIDNCDVSGFNQYGIYIYVEDSGSWYNNVRITNSSIHDNIMAGISSGAAALYGVENIYVGRDTVYHNTGDGNSPTNATGSGILITACDGGTVEWCAAYDNGTNGNGSGGIWCANSTRMLLQHNEAYQNHTTGDRDGDGMGFDINTSYSILQYNYVFENDGNGLQLNNWMDNNTETNNIIRYNIAVNNGLKNGYSDIEVWGRILNSALYNNVIYMSPDSLTGIKIHNNSIPSLFVDNVQVLNNIIISNGGKPLIYVSSGETAGAQGLVFMGNDYWAASGSFTLSYGGVNYSSLSAWQSATKQETSGGKDVGFEVNPELVDAGSDPVFVDPASIVSLSGYLLSSTSPLINKGVGVPSEGDASPLVDFYGNALPTSGVDVGANQAGGTVVNPPPPPPPPPPPSGWSNADIGAVGSKGSSTSSSGTYTLTGSGADIYGTADAFQYDYQSLDGDGQIIAKVNSISAADAWAKAGLMIRDGNAAGAKEVSMVMSYNGKAEFERRFSANQYTKTTDVAAATPGWVKLVRQGNNFYGYISKDGVTWTEVASTAVVMNTNVEIGLVATSHDVTTKETAVFSNVSVT